MRRRALSFEIMFEIFSLSVDPCGFARVGSARAARFRAPCTPTQHDGPTLHSPGTRGSAGNPDVLRLTDVRSRQTSHVDTIRDSAPVPTPRHRHVPRPANNSSPKARSTRPRTGGSGRTRASHAIGAPGPGSIGVSGFYWRFRVSSFSERIIFTAGSTTTYHHTECCGTTCTTTSQLLALYALLIHSAPHRLVLARRTPDSIRLDYGSRPAASDPSVGRFENGFRLYVLHVSDFSPRPPRESGEPALTRPGLDVPCPGPFLTSSLHQSSHTRSRSRRP